jgi:hypothetical protein
MAAISDEIASERMLMGITAETTPWQSGKKMLRESIQPGIRHRVSLGLVTQLIGQFVSLRRRSSVRDRHFDVSSPERRQRHQLCVPYSPSSPRQRADPAVYHNFCSQSSLFISFLLSARRLTVELLDSYLPRIFRSLGVTGTSLELFATGVCTFPLHPSPVAGT